MKNIKNNVKGITLVTLIITIVVLLILASFATYSGIDVIKSSKFKKFTTELKIMQTQVNQLYDKYKSGDKEILNLGKELNIDTVQDQVNKVFTSSESGITDPTGYRYFDTATIQELNIQGIEEEFFINIEKRSVVSYKGFKYEGVTYYTLEQIPNRLYNIDYENKNIKTPTFKAKAEEIGENKWKINVLDIKYSGYINKWKVNYKLEGQNNWNISKDYSFIVKESGMYKVKLVNGSIESEEIGIKIANRRLPYGYKQVEYIECTGEQYINSIYFPSEFRYELECELKHDTSYYNIFDTAKTPYVMFWVVNGQLEANADNANKLSTPMEEKITVFYDILNSEGKFGYISSKEKKDLGFTKKVTDCIVELFNRNGEIAYKGKIYSIRIYDSKDLKYNFIPCYTTTPVIDVNGKLCPSGTIGLYETVEGKFYTNQGAGEFDIKDSQDDNNQGDNNQGDNNQDLITLPSEYQRAEYIEGTGEQYFLLDVVSTANFGFDIDMSVSTGTGANVFGGFSRGGQAFCYLGTRNNKITYFPSNNGFDFTKTDYYVRHSYKVINKGGNLSYSYDSNPSTTVSFTNNANCSIAVFSFVDNNGVVRTSKTETFAGKIYEFIIYDNETVICNLIPCYRKSDNEVGMYDIINNKFYTNQGTGTFGTDTIEAKAN